MKFEDVVKQFLSESHFSAFSVFASDIDGFLNGFTVPPGVTHIWESDRDRLTLQSHTGTSGYGWAPGVLVLPFIHEPIRPKEVGLHHHHGFNDSRIKIVVFESPVTGWRVAAVDGLTNWIKESLLPRVGEPPVRITSPTSVPSAPSATFVKHSSDKPRPALFPPMALESVAAVLAFGSKKYAPGNWKNAPTWSVYGDAVLRHFFAFLRGEDTDPESGLPHLSHCACSLLFLIEFQLRKWSVDDRLSAPKDGGKT